MDSPPSRASRSRRVLKVVYDDPNATDSSSDERKNISVDKKTMKKRVVFEISFPKVPSDQTVDNELNKNNKCETPKDEVNKNNKCGTPKDEVNKNNKSCRSQIYDVKQPSCKYRGVRMRKWGRYSAEIRNPFNNQRNWLGTFDSAEEASKAYETKRHEFETIYKDNLHRGKRNKRPKKVSFAEPLVTSLNDFKRETSNISLPSTEFVNHVEVSSDETNSLQKTDIVQESDVITSVDASSQLESDLFTLDELELDLVAGDDPDSFDDSNNIDIPLNFDYLDTQFAVMKEPHKRSSEKELPKISKQIKIKEPHNISEQ